MNALTLAEVADRLEAAYEKARADLEREIVRFGSPCQPEDMRDSNGRYVLLDALVALTQARTALSR